MKEIGMNNVTGIEPIRGATITINHTNFPKLGSDLMDNESDVCKLVDEVREQTQRHWMHYILAVLNKDIDKSDKFDEIKALAVRLTL